MSEVAVRELRNSTRALLDRLDAGESLALDSDGGPIAVLAPTAPRPRWISRAEFSSRVLAHQSDPHLGADLDELLGQTADELPS